MKKRLRDKRGRFCRKQRRYAGGRFCKSGSTILSTDLAKLFDERVHKAFHSYLEKAPTEYEGWSKIEPEKFVIRFTCSNHFEHQHRWRWSAWLCGKIQWMLGYLP